MPKSYSIDRWSFLLLLSGIAGFSAFAWGVRGHFIGDKTPSAMNVILALSLIGIVVFLFDVWVTSTPDWARATGFSLHLLGIALFGWAVLATRQNQAGNGLRGKPTGSCLQIEGPTPHPPPFLYVLSALLARMRHCDFVVYSCSSYSWL